MAEFNPLKRQVTNMDFASPSQFRFQLLKIPTVEYFVTQVNIPGISFGGDASISTPFSTIHMMGDNIDFADLEVQFLVNEDLSNYREIHDWLIGIGFPKNREQFTNAVQGANPELRAASKENDPNKASAGNPAALMSDATLMILTNKNNPKVQVNFKNVFPTSLSGLDYNSQTTDSEQLTASVTFKYDIYEFASL